MIGLWRLWVAKSEPTASVQDSNGSSRKARVRMSVVLEGLSETLNSRGLDVSFYSMKGGEGQRNLVFNELLLRKKVDGVLTIAVKLTEDELTNLTNLRKPIVGVVSINDFL